MSTPLDSPDELPNRHKPTHGVKTFRHLPTIIFLTVCTKNRQPWLASAEIHDLLVNTWTNATAWLVGRYVILPDHLHLFATPGTPELPLENWVKFWKSRLSNAHRNPAHAWQVDHWDRRLRSDDSYDEKWQYVRDNPVRHGLVKSADEWPYQGELNLLRWRGG
jgi:REP element-mobilizing transposase RayT